MVKLTKRMRACLEWYRDKENDSDRVQHRPYLFGCREMNGALDLGFMFVGENGWHVLTPAGLSALSDSKGPSTERCHADRDGDCNHANCPQLRDGEPKKSGRHCPIDTWKDDE